MEIQVHAEGCVLGVRAQPGAKKNAVTGLHNGLVKIAVNAPPKKGKANDALVEVLSEALDWKRSQIELIAGATSREKKFLIRGLDPAEVERRLTLVLG